MTAVECNVKYDFVAPLNIKENSWKTTGFADIKNLHSRGGGGIKKGLRSCILQIQIFYSPCNLQLATVTTIKLSERLSHLIKKLYSLLLLLTPIEKGQVFQRFMSVSITFVAIKQVPFYFLLLFLGYWITFCNFTLEDQILPTCY